MKAAIIQLSDIHIKSNNDFIIQKKDAFFRSCKSIINQCSRLIIVITGDIASSGKKEEYDIALNWLKDCESLWKEEAKFLNTIDYVIVPGNHDCNLSDLSEIRNIIIKKILQNDNLNSDELSKECLKAQINFWNFYNKLTGETYQPQISWEINIMLKIDYRLIFNCYNSAFLSQLEEKPGELLIPKDHFLNTEKKKDNDLVISIFHHNTGWLNPNTNLNNKKIFEEHIYSNSNIVMCGHEHHNTQHVVSNLGDFNELIYLENSAFQNSNKSEYGLLCLDTDENTLSEFTYKYKDNCYYQSTPIIIKIHKKRTGITMTASWLEKLDEISIPLKHARKEHLCLSDIFIFPDLEPLSEINNKYEQYIDSENLISEKITERIVLLEGESQSGKSSLLQMLFSTCYKKGIYPMFLSGKQISHYKIHPLLEKEYKKQYKCELFSYSQYSQLDRSKRILFIDDFDKTSINTESKSKLLDNLLCNFEKIIITNSQQLDIKSLLLQTNCDSEIKRFRILSLGYHKRNILIEKWIRLGQNYMTLDEAVLLDQIRQTYDKITILLGQQLIPSYPVFILSLMQGLNQAMEGFNISKTSYAYCYNSLIISSLLKSGTEKEKINGVLKFLSEFSYYYYTKNNEAKEFSMKDYECFYNNYKKEYNVPYGIEKLLKILCEADLIRYIEGEYYSFSYRYVFYYLVAQKISELVNNNKADGIIQELCKKLHKEREANILIFLVYHNGTEKQMEDLLFTSWLPFEDYKPITLQLDDPLFNDLNNIVDGIKANVLLQNTDPKENRDVALRKSDDEQRKLNTFDKPTDEDFEDNQYLRDLNNTYKIIRILGQIVKNQKETLKKEQIIKLIEESYYVCFRSIAFFNNLIDNSKEEVLSLFLDKNKNSLKLDEKTLEDKVRKMLHMLLYHHCLRSFANLSCAVGTSDMSDIFDEVAARINTPAAKIISFTIKTYYNKMEFKDLKDLVNEFKDNPVAMEIIKARVINYVYNNYLDISVRQRIGQLCNLQLIDNNKKITNKRYNDSENQIR